MFEVRNEAERVEVLLYDEVGESVDWWTGETYGVSAKDFKAMLDEASPKPIDLHIDSPGGDVFDAYAMCSAIQRYPGDVHCYVDGLAASAASYVAVVCDEVTMNDYAYLMIHSATARCCGNARDLEGVVERLRMIDKNIAAIYAKRSDLSVEQALEYMDAETWFTGEEAKACGLCTEVVETEERLAACCDARRARDYRNIPKGVTVGARKSDARPTMQDEGPSYAVLDGKIYEGIKA